MNAFVNERAGSRTRFYRAISRWLRPAGASGATAIALSATQRRYCLCWRWTVGVLRAVVSQFRCPRRYCQSLERTRGRACTSLSVLAAAGVLTAVPSARLTVLTVLRAGQIDTGGTGLSRLGEQSARSPMKTHVQRMRARNLLMVNS